MWTVIGRERREPALFLKGWHLQDSPTPHPQSSAEYTPGVCFVKTKEQLKAEYALWFVADRLSRTLQYAQSRPATARPDIVISIQEALGATKRAHEEECQQ